MSLSDSKRPKYGSLPPPSSKATKAGFFVGGLILALLLLVMYTAVARFILMTAADAGAFDWKISNLRLSVVVFLLLSVRWGRNFENLSRSRKKN